MLSDTSIPLYLPPTHQVPQRSPIETSLSTLLASGAALGHSTSLLNPFYTPYVYGNRSGISIIDLDQTLPILRRTASMIREVVKADGVILVVGTRRAHERILEKAKSRLGDNGFVVNDWLPGTLTNSETLYVLPNAMRRGANDSFGVEPIREGSYVPDVVIFLNPSENLSAIRECTLKNIPTVGIVDSDIDPRLVTYPIPANMEVSFLSTFHI
jgi:small subunit ribosomal protein S2